MSSAPTAPTPRGILRPRTLGEALKLLQHRAGVNRDDLARDSGVSTGALSNYLNDVSVPSAATLRRIATALASRLSEDADEVWSELGGLLDRGGLLLTTQVVPGLARRLGADPARLWSQLGEVLDHPLDDLAEWSQVIEHTHTVADYRTDLYWLLRFSMRLRAPLREATPEDVASFLGILDPRTGATSTAIQALGRFYGWLVERGHRDDDPVAGLRED
ncbi:MAG: helix-turn-helix domain-containing protein [Actinobacteria bacterium]|nr:helix-turn-helix domain-containing protein [Actinomycetota bacterium]